MTAVAFCFLTAVLIFYTLSFFFYPTRKRDEMLLWLKFFFVSDDENGIKHNDSRVLRLIVYGHFKCAI